MVQLNLLHTTYTPAERWPQAHALLDGAPAANLWGYSEEKQTQPDLRKLQWIKDLSTTSHSGDDGFAEYLS